MNPIPCAHCGINFMRTIQNTENDKLCNSCALREDKRKPKIEGKMKTIDILIKCPIPVHAEIEEYCRNEGIDFSQYFLSLHEFKDLQEPNLDKEDDAKLESKKIPENIKKQKRNK